MGVLETIIIALGGPAILIGAVAFMGKSLLSQWLAKELKKHESDLNRESRQFELELKSKYDAAAERLRSDLQLQGSEHQVRFAKLHEKRAEVIAEAYRLLVVAFWEAQSAVSPLQLAGDPSQDEKCARAHDRLEEFYRYFDVHKLYLPADVCKKIDSMYSKTRSALMRLETSLSLGNSPVAALLGTKVNLRVSAWRTIQQEVSVARSGLEQELRSLLGQRHDQPMP